ncbi:MAG: SCO family protein [Nitrospinota bacterium]
MGVFLILPITTAQAAPSVLERSEGALGRKVGNYRLVDQDGRHLPFFTFKGKTILLSFMYIDCPDMCLLTGQSLKRFVDTMNPELKEKVVLVSVSMDPENDTPEKLRNYGSEYSDDFSKWYFTTTDSDTLAKMISDLGFTFEKKVEGEIEHLSRITLIRPDGVVARHFYGAEFDPKDIEESVKSVIEGQTITSRISGNLSKFLIYCSNYDPKTKTYRVDYGAIFFALVNGVLVFATIIYLLRFKIKKILFKGR